MADREEDFWFHAKSYGWGWGLPARWQGWLALVLYLAMTIGGAAMVPAPGNVAVVALLTVLFVVVVVFKGERPLRWRWGRKEGE